MDAFLAICSLFLFSSFLYARLVNGNNVLVHVISPATALAEQFVWWGLFCLSCKATSASLHRLLGRAKQTAMGVSTGTIVALACVSGVCWVAQYVDAQNSSKIFTQVFPPKFAIAILILSAVAFRRKREIVRHSLLTEDSYTQILHYGQESTVQMPISPCRNTILSSISITLGITAWQLKRRTDVLPDILLGYPFQVFELLCIFVIPSLSLESLSRSTYARQYRWARLSAEMLMIGLMGIAAFMLP